MPDTTIVREIEIDAPAERVWPYVATEEGLRRWWGGAISLEPHEGGRCVERTFLQGEAREQAGVVTVYQPPRQLTLALRPVGRDAPAPLLTHISITLVEEAGRTRVTVLHRAAAPEPALVPARRLPALPAMRSGPRMELEPQGADLGLGVHAAAGAPSLALMAVQHQWDVRLAQLRETVNQESILGEDADHG